MSGERFVVGIDLGTTHTALAYAPDVAPDPKTAEGATPSTILPLPQIVAKGALEARPLLPSFTYLAHESDGPLNLPWSAADASDATPRYAVGEYARSRGVEAPTRLVASAKSWLSHGAVDRRAPILPVAAAEDVQKISPVEASRRYLAHLAQAWNAGVAHDDPALALARQDVVLTVPASFDAAARELTVQAATEAGLANLTLLEEPQAALYAWIEASGDSWRKQVHPGDVILVIDVGGGTTDFSAIAAVDKDGSLDLVRVAVGDHILLGGDNMDLALAHVARQKLEADGKTLDRAQMAALGFASRSAKEELLGGGAATAYPIALASRGAKLIGGTLRTELTKDEVIATVAEGFFPEVPASARPAVRARAALTQLGLPFAQDAGITRHLAAFLARQKDATAKLGAGDAAGDKPLLCPTTLLFNGGVMKSAVLRDHLVRTVNGWLAEVGAPPVKVLGEADLDLAVARGAAAFALARRGRGLRIRGGTARAYYVGIEDAAPAVPGMEPPITAMCLAPFGMEEGSEAELPKTELGVVVGEKVSFRFFGSTTRRNDVAGTTLERWAPGELEELSPLEVTLPAEGRTEGDVVPVHLHAAVTEIGTLRLEARPTEPRVPGEHWDVELSVRDQPAS